MILLSVEEHFVNNIPLEELCKNMPMLVILRFEFHSDVNFSIVNYFLSQASDLLKGMILDKLAKKNRVLFPL